MCDLSSVLGRGGSIAVKERVHQVLRAVRAAALAKAAQFQLKGRPRSALAGIISRKISEHIVGIQQGEGVYESPPVFAALSMGGALGRFAAGVIPRSLLHAQPSGFTYAMI